MSRAGVTLHWFLPTASDSRHLLNSFHAASSRGTGSADFRAPSLDYLGQVAQGARQAALTPCPTSTSAGRPTP